MSKFIADELTSAALRPVCPTVHVVSRGMSVSLVVMQLSARSALGMDVPAPAVSAACKDEEQQGESRRQLGAGACCPCTEAG